MSIKQNEKTTQEYLSVRSEQEETSAPQAMAKKKQFVEPAISVHIDVLEATTFFQAMDTGGTG